MQRMGGRRLAPSCMLASCDTDDDSDDGFDGDGVDGGVGDSDSVGDGIGDIDDVGDCVGDDDGYDVGSGVSGHDGDDELAHAACKSVVQ